MWYLTDARTGGTLEAVEVRFADKRLDRLEVDPGHDGGYARPVVTQTIRGAPDERVFYSLKSLHFEKLKGNRSHQWSMRLNEQ
jgi:proteic killer suppression protein